MISDLGESLRRIFAATAHVGTRFHVISIFYLRCAHDKIHTWNYLLLENLQGKSKPEESPRSRKKKKSIEERKKGRKSTILSRKEKKYLFESDW